MNIRRRFLSLVPFIICIFLFCLSFYQQASVICIILLVTAWLASPDFVKSFKKVDDNKILLILVSFYILHALSIFYSTNLNYAFFDLQVKLSFLLFPLILSAFVFSQEQINRFKLLFSAGTLLTTLLCLGYSVSSFIR